MVAVCVVCVLMLCFDRIPSCKQYTELRTCHTRKHFLACGSSGAHASQSALCCVIFSKEPHRIISCRTLHAHGLIVFFFSFAAQPPSPLHLPIKSIPCHPQQGLSLGRFAEQSPLLRTLFHKICFTDLYFDIFQHLFHVYFLKKGLTFLRTFLTYLPLYLFTLLNFGP